MKMNKRKSIDQSAKCTIISKMATNGENDPLLKRDLSEGTQQSNCFTVISQFMGLLVHAPAQLLMEHIKPQVPVRGVSHNLYCSSRQQLVLYLVPLAGTVKVINQYIKQRQLHTSYLTRRVLHDFLISLYASFVSLQTGNVLTQASIAFLTS